MRHKTYSFQQLDASTAWTGMTATALETQFFSGEGGNRWCKEPARERLQRAYVFALASPSSYIQKPRPAVMSPSCIRAMRASSDKHTCTFVIQCPPSRWGPPQPVTPRLTCGAFQTTPRATLAAWAPQSPTSDTASSVLIIPKVDIAAKLYVEALSQDVGQD